MTYAECSAKTGNGVAELFQRLIKDVFDAKLLLADGHRKKNQIKLTSSNGSAGENEKCRCVWLIVRLVPNHKREYMCVCVFCLIGTTPLPPRKSTVVTYFALFFIMCVNWWPVSIFVYTVSLSHWSISFTPLLSTVQWDVLCDRLWCIVVMSDTSVPIAMVWNQSAALNIFVYACWLPMWWRALFGYMYDFSRSVLFGQYVCGSYLSLTYGRAWISVSVDSLSNTYYNY